MPSPEHEQIVAMMGGGLGLDQLSLAEQRELMDAAADLFPIPEGVQVDEVDAGGVPADRIVPDCASGRVLVYLHGGAYVTGSRLSHRSLAARLARAASAIVVVPEYRLAPEHPCPAAVEDSVATVRWVRSSGHAPDALALAGDSAGGGLALATLLALKRAGDPLPACAVAMSPWLDLAVVDRDTGVDDPLLSAQGLIDNARMYAGDRVREPLASPLRGDLRGLPPVLLQTGTRDLLHTDSLRFAEAARAAGVDVTLSVGEGLIHVWHMYPSLTESQAALEEIGAFVKQCCRK